MRVSDDAQARRAEGDGHRRRRRGRDRRSLARAVAPIALGAHAGAGGRRLLRAGLAEGGRAWGIACQLYGLRSERNWGIGDFEDLARFAEIAAAAGADFVGVNPLHALFLAEPERCSPFSPSNRAFPEPALYRHRPGAGLRGHGGRARSAATTCATSELVDYRAVGALKTKALEHPLPHLLRRAPTRPIAEDFERFVAERGQPLYLHALFEALSEAMVQQGHGADLARLAGRIPPPEHATRCAPSPRSSASSSPSTPGCNGSPTASSREAQARARGAGMRIGLYLDLAVGVAPDGSATWSDRGLAVPSARIGAPPDYFNADGQDWGLAPLSPAGLVARIFEPYRDVARRGRCAMPARSASTTP